MWLTQVLGCVLTIITIFSARLSDTKEKITNYYSSEHKQWTSKPNAAINKYLNSLLKTKTQFIVQGNYFQFFLFSIENLIYEAFTRVWVWLTLTWPSWLDLRWLSLTLSPNIITLVFSAVYQHIKYPIGSIWSLVNQVQVTRFKRKWGFMHLDNLSEALYSSLYSITGKKNYR